MRMLMEEFEASDFIHLRVLMGGSISQFRIALPKAMRSDIVEYIVPVLREILVRGARVKIRRKYTVPQHQTRQTNRWR
jgi:hypothetical protein